MIGCIVWLPWSKDLFDTVQYEDFCRQNRELFPLLSTVEQSKSRISEIRRQLITSISPGDSSYLPLRHICPYWYLDLNMPDEYHTLYIVTLHFGNWTRPTSRLHIAADIPVFQHHIPALDNYFVTFYASHHTLTTSMVLLDHDYFVQHPEHIPPVDVLKRMHKKP